jgi:predicted HTH domain antitoxin
MVRRTIQVEVPEEILLAEKTDAESFGRRLKILAAVKLYELGRLTSGRAAELAGMQRLEFLAALREYQVFPLAAELRDLEVTNAGRHQ